MKPRQHTLTRSAIPSSPTRRSFLATLAAAAACGLALLAVPGSAQSVPAAIDPLPVNLPMASGAEPNHSVRKEAHTVTTLTRLDTDATAIRPFHAHVPEEALVDLRRRIAATRWPDPETVSDRSQGAQLATMKDLVRYWGTDYDWRKAEAKLNALPQFVTNIDGVDIHFIHVRSRQPNAMPLIMTHGWPGSIFELLKVIDPLTDPTAHGGRAEDAFDLVIPSMPGYGFSGKPQATGWNPDHIARAWAVLMKRLGYTHYVAQGGDWGSVVADVMARQKPEGTAGYPHQYACDRTPGDREGSRLRRSGAGRTVSRGEGRV